MIVEVNGKAYEVKTKKSGEVTLIRPERQYQRELVIGTVERVVENVMPRNIASSFVRERVYFRPVVKRTVLTDDGLSGLGKYSKRGDALSILVENYLRVEAATKAKNEAEWAELKRKRTEYVSASVEALADLSVLTEMSRREIDRILNSGDDVGMSLYLSVDTGERCGIAEPGVRLSFPFGSGSGSAVQPPDVEVRGLTLNGSFEEVQRAHALNGTVLALASAVSAAVEAVRVRQEREEVSG